MKLDEVATQPTQQKPPRRIAVICWTQEAQEASRPQRVSVVSATESKAERLADLMGGFRGTGAVGKKKHQ